MQESLQYQLDNLRYKLESIFVWPLMSLLERVAGWLLRAVEFFVVRQEVQQEQESEDQPTDDFMARLSPSEIERLDRANEILVELAMGVTAEEAVRRLGYSEQRSDVDDPQSAPARWRLDDDGEIVDLDIEFKCHKNGSKCLYTIEGVM